MQRFVIMQAYFVKANGQKNRTTLSQFITVRVLLSNWTINFGCISA